MKARVFGWFVPEFMTPIRRSSVVLIAALLCAAFVTGCGSTPESRIRQNPMLFDQLNAEQQDLIRRGQVAIGFSAEMVRLALGEPDRYTTRSDADGTSEVWHYVTYEMADGSPLYRGWYHRYYMWNDPFYPWYLSHDARRERERFSVVFRNGAVRELEHERSR